MTEKAIVLWSRGKDSSLALYEVLNTGSYEILGLLTTVTKDYDRISIHSVRHVLLEQQAQALHIPLEEIFITKSASNAEYEAKLLKTLKMLRNNGGSSVVFGDLFLEDIRKYRERLLAKAE